MKFKKPSSHDARSEQPLSAFDDYETLDGTCVSFTRIVTKEDALLFAVTEGQNQEVIKLLSEGVPIDIRDKDGNTPLILAADAGHIDIVKQLLFSGAYIDSKMILGENALMAAVTKNHIEIVKELISHGIDINSKENIGFTALMLATLFERTDIVKELIKSGADLFSKNDKGDTALMIAIERGYIEMATLIKEAAYQRYKQELEPLYHQSVAVAMAKHPRLGADSPAAIVDAHPLKKILLYAQKEQKVDIEAKYAEFQDKPGQFKDRLRLERLGMTPKKTYTNVFQK